MSRYDLDAIRRGIRDPGRILGELRRLGVIVNSRLASEATNVESVIDRDWDVLAILDGCRYDLFVKESTLDGQTAAFNSNASQSTDFMKSHFCGRENHDIVYVSANIYTERLETGVFHDIKNVYDTHWNENLGTVAPESVADVAIKTVYKYPHKRLIVHFMQPHYPFLGETGRSFDSGDISGDGSGTGHDIWTKIQNCRSPVDEDTVWEAYAENYRLVEDSVRRLDDEITGKLVVTADHGNLVGERLSPIPVKAYGHPSGVVHPALRTVPWHEMPVSQRREIRADPPQVVNKSETDDIEEKLAALGYR